MTETRRTALYGNAWRTALVVVKTRQPVGGHHKLHSIMYTIQN